MMTEKEANATPYVEFVNQVDPTEKNLEEEDGETIVRGVDQIATESECVDVEQLHAEVVEFLTNEAKQLAL